MNKECINYFKLANTQLSLELPHTSEVKAPKCRAKQISVAFHEATHFVIEITHRCVPLEVTIANTIRGHDIFGATALGSCYTIDTGGFSLIDSFLAAGFYEMVLGDEISCDIEVRQAEDEYQSYQLKNEAVCFNGLKGRFIDVGNKVIDIWPLIYICAMAFLLYRGKTSLGQVPDWVLNELNDLILTMMADGSVKGVKNGEEVRLDFDYFSNHTPRILDCVLWLKSHIQSKETDEYKELYSTYFFELYRHNNRFSSCKPSLPV